MARLSLTYPLDSKLFNQGFGENPQVYSDPKFGGIKGHNGMDFYAGHGTPIFASLDGIAHYEIDPGGGHGVVILSNDKFEDINGRSSYWKTIYWHMCDSNKEPQYKSPIEGKTIGVKRGELIGYADNTGFSTGDHLHFGLKPFDQVNLDQNNGYGGCVNPNIYLTSVIPQDIPKEIVRLKQQVSILQSLINLYKRLLGR